MLILKSRKYCTSPLIIYVLTLSSCSTSLCFILCQLCHNWLEPENLEMLDVQTTLHERRDKESSYLISPSSQHMKNLHLKADITISLTDFTDYKYCRRYSPTCQIFKKDNLWAIKICHQDDCFSPNIRHVVCLFQCMI